MHFHDSCRLAPRASGWGPDPSSAPIATGEFVRVRARHGHSRASVAGTSVAGAATCDAKNRMAEREPQLRPTKRYSRVPAYSEIEGQIDDAEADKRSCNSWGESAAK